jgi:hypothetical protein
MNTAQSAQSYSCVCYQATASTFQLANKDAKILANVFSGFGVYKAKLAK